MLLNLPHNSKIIGSKTHNSFRKGLQYVYYLKSHLVRINCGLCDIYCDIINRKILPSCSRWIFGFETLWFWLMQIIWMIKDTVPNSSFSHAVYITQADYWSPVTKKRVMWHIRFWWHFLGKKVTCMACIDMMHVTVNLKRPQ